MSEKSGFAMVLGVLAGLIFLLLRAWTQSTGVPFFVCLAVLAAVLWAWQRHGEQSATSEEAALSPTSGSAPAPRTALQRQELEQGRHTVQEIEGLIAALKDKTARKEAEDCVRLCDAVLQAAAENETAQSHLTNFFRHYLPMFQQMLENYAKCEAAAVLPEATTKEFLQFLDTMEDAMKQLKENVYTKDIDRLAIDMDVLETLYRSDGLLDDGLKENREEGVAHGTT